MNALPSRRFAGALSLITLAGGILRSYWLWGLAPTNDDAGVAWTAVGYVLHGQTWPTMPHHPVLRNLLVFLSTRVLGGSVLGVKGFSLLFGTLLVGLTGLLVRRAVGDERAGLFAAAIVGLDIVQIVYSRQGVNDIHAAFFAVTGVWLTVEALRAERTRSWGWLLPLAGLSFGLGAASKFYALPLMTASAVLLVISAWKRRLLPEILVTVASVGLLPFLVYLLTYIPWFGRGYGTPEWFRYQAALVDAMATHTKPEVGFRANNRAIWWFLRPFYSIAEVATVGSRVDLSIGVGDPLVWLAVLPAAGYSLIAPEQRRRDWLLLVFFLASYLPLALTSRPIWLLSSVAVIPFAAGLIGSVASTLTERFGRKVAWVYGTAVLVTSLALYPLAIGRSLQVGYLHPIVARTGDFWTNPRW